MIDEVMAVAQGHETRGAAFDAIVAFLDDIGAASCVIELGGPSHWVSQNWVTDMRDDRTLFSTSHLHGFLHPDDLRSGLELVDQLRERIADTTTASHPVVRRDLRVRRPSGSYQWTEVMMNVVSAGQGHRFVVAVLSDATRLHDARRDLAAMTLAESEASRSTAEFVSKMSHELRTPLHAILGYAQLLEMGAGDPAEYLARLRRAGDHLVHLLDDLLDFSRLNAGRLTVNDDIVDLRSVIDGAIDMVAGVASASEVSIHQPEVAPVEVRGDATRLRQVIANLLSNGIKYNRAGGSVTVSSEVVADRVLVDIVDTGNGIAREALPRLFVPFDRLGAEGSGVSGVGLGLPLTNGLVHAMGGSIEVKSAVGEGTRFRVWLRRPNDRSLDTRQIVCIDDDPESRRILDTVLSMMPGAVVSTAANGAAGLRLIEETAPSLIVLDRHLPDYDPAELLAAVTVRAPGCPVIMVSSDPAVLEPGFVVPPIVAAFAKPLDLDVFIDATERTWAMRDT